MHPMAQRQRATVCLPAETTLQNKLSLPVFLRSKGKIMPRIRKPRDYSWAKIARRTWQKGDADDIFGRSAQLAYYFFLALFPMLIFLISTLGIFPGAGEHIRNGMFQFLSQALPAAASDLIQKTMNEVTSASGIAKLSFGLIVS